MSVVEVPEQRFFAFTEQTVLGEPVQMATLERALLDALDRPQHGGLGEVSRIVSHAAASASSGVRCSTSHTGGRQRPWSSGSDVSWICTGPRCRQTRARSSSR